MRLYLILAFVLLLSQTRVDTQPQLRALSRAQAGACVDSIGREWVSLKARMQPHWATSVGIRGHDGELATYTQRTVGQSLRKVFHLKRVLNSFGEDSLSISGWVDRELLLADMETYEFWFADQVMWRRSPLPYTDAIIEGVVNLLLGGEEDSLSEHLASRLAATLRVIADARTNVTDPISVQCAVASSDLRGFIPLLEPSVIRSRVPGGVSNTMLRLAELTADSLAAFAEFIDSLAAGADTEYALGAENYASFIRSAHLLEEPLESLLSQANQALSRAQSELEGMGPISRPGPPAPTGVTDVPGLEGRYSLADPDCSAAWHSDNLTSAFAAIEAADVLSLIPEDEHIVLGRIPTSMLTGAWAVYRPPRVAGAGEGAVYVLSKVESWREYADYGSLWGLKTVRYYYPAQHLSEVRVARHESFVRRYMRDDIGRDGWVLYFEGLRAEIAPRGEASPRFRLEDIAFQAASLIAEIKLHTGEFDLDEAADFIARQTERPRQLALMDARRYAVAPGSGIGYLIGRDGILRLKERYESIKRNSFDLKEFHDTLLSCGYLPPYLLSIEVMSKGMGRE